MAAAALLVNCYSCCQPHLGPLHCPQHCRGLLLHALLTRLQGERLMRRTPAMLQFLQPPAVAAARCPKAHCSAMAAHFLPAGAGRSCFGHCCLACSAATAVPAARPAGARWRSVHWAAMSPAAWLQAQQCCSPSAAQAQRLYAWAAQHTHRRMQAEHMLLVVAASQPY